MKKPDQPALNLYMTDEFKQLLKAAADAKGQSAEKEAAAALGSYVLNAFQQLNPSQEDML